MHELSVTESILEIALRHARQAGAARISALHLTIGDLASIVDESVQFYWDIISQDTIASGAQLIFERIPAQMSCQSCGLEFEPEREQLSCPRCHGYQLKLLRGDEFTLSAMDIEKEPNPSDLELTNEPTHPGS
jgi:hydrogenase nickel incorporation protein HypA/HybF